MAPSAHAEANNKHLIGNHPEISKLLKYLKKDDVETYERIFSLQKDGAWNKANIEIKKLENKILIGHVMAQRYLHPTKYRSKYKELKDWMKKYSDHPQSRRIYKLALRRKPKDEILKFKPSAPAYVPNYFSPQTNTAKEKYSKKERIAYAKLRRKVSRFLKKDQVTKAVNFLEEDRSYQSLGGSMKAKLLNKIALGYLYSEKINLAERFSQRSVNLSKNHLHSSLWIAGLVKWKLGKFDQSITYLERITQLENIPKSVLAKSTYWLARANLINRKPEETIKWLKITAAYSDTFYGNLARRNLNLPIKLPNNSMPSIKKIELDEIREKKRGARSFALLQIKQHELAEKELIILYSDNPRKFYLPLLSLSVDMKLPRLAMKLAKDSDPDEKKFYQALFPIPKWNLKDSKNIDRALIYAIIRQESEFNASAKSRAGARGLMQILPRTAMSVAKQQKIRYLGRWQLMEAEKNIELGRKYISKLLKRKSINNNLVFMSVAYNSGIRNLAKWQKKMNFLNDPLLFIEMIPIRETKGYVKKIFNNIWFYREILGQDKASLDLLASGEWPEYVHLDQR
jgi:soluble lytic murein transglycosylase-like protein|tara:strand:- start:924 stop:2633 length:1710 start_codon:yes stop_codon:yes gene_type:complete